MLISSTDSEEELSLLQRLAKEGGAFDAVVCSHWVFLKQNYDMKLFPLTEFLLATGDRKSRSCITC